MADMAKRAALSTTWIEEGLNKLNAKFSNVVCFETDDQERFHQLLGFLPQHEDYGQHQLFLYDRWKGLSRFDRQQTRFLPVNAGEGDRYAVRVAENTGVETALRDIGAALRHLDRVLKTQSAILLLQDLESSQETGSDRDPLLVAALRSWCLDAEVGYQRSAVMIFSSRSELVLDGHTAQRAAIIPIDLSQDTERAFMIHQAARDIGVEREALSQLGRLVRLTAGLNLHQLRTIILESYYRTGSISDGEIAHLKADWIKREEIVEILEPQGGFETVGGYAEVKSFVIQNIIQVLAEPERATHFGVPLPRGILIFGPPGTGKSLFSKALAGETHLPFINFKTENLYTEFLGGSGRNFKRAIAIAEKNSPAIVFIDEIDKFGKRRGTATDGASEETRRVYNQVLEWLGDPKRQSILVGTTNRPGDLDAAFLRAGRLDYKIPFLYPDTGARAEILKIHLGMTGCYPLIPVNSQEELERILEQLVNKTENFSGAELEELARRIRRQAFSRQAQYVEAQDYQQVLQNFTINQEERQQEIKMYLDFAREFTNEASFLGTQG
jgi:AAA+ superfamily predicted ATPase